MLFDILNIMKSCRKCGRHGHYAPTCGTKRQKMIKFDRKQRVYDPQGKRYWGIGSFGALRLYYGYRTRRKHPRQDRNVFIDLYNYGDGWEVEIKIGQKSGKGNVKKYSSKRSAVKAFTSFIASKLNEGYTIAK